MDRNIDRFEQAMESIHSFDFDPMKMSDELGRENLFTMTVYKMITNLPKNGNCHKLNTDKLVHFLSKIGSGYRHNVQYHNDLHGADVAQSMYMFITQGMLNTVAQLSYLDIVSAITAAACHDYDHDGYNNSYHVKFMTDRAIRSNDKSVQESWHAAEALSILLRQENRFIEDISPDELKVMRIRITGMILATDMANHNAHIDVYKNKIQHNGIKMENNNGSLLIDGEENQDVFKNQQDMLEFMVHSSDFVSFTRKFDTNHDWTYLLFEEFFNQGDMEKENEKEIYFLCDRTTTIVAKTQPGFASFIVIPTWDIIRTILPNINEAFQRIE